MFSGLLMPSPTPATQCLARSQKCVGLYLRLYLSDGSRSSVGKKHSALLSASLGASTWAATKSETDFWGFSFKQQFQGASGYMLEFQSKVWGFLSKLEEVRWMNEWRKKLLYFNTIAVGNVSGSLQIPTDHFSLEVITELKRCRV